MWYNGPRAHSLSPSNSLTHPLISRLIKFTRSVTGHSLTTCQALHKAETLLAENTQLGKEGETLRDEARALREELEVRGRHAFWVEPLSCLVRSSAFPRNSANLRVDCSYAGHFTML